MRIIGLAIIVFCSSAVCAIADPVTFTDEVHHVSFAYDVERWKPSPKKGGSQVLHTVVWTDLGGKILATCKLQAAEMDHARGVHASKSILTDAMLMVLREREPKVELVSSTEARADSLEALHNVWRVPGPESPILIDGMLTYRGKTMINLDCMYPESPIADYTHGITREIAAILGSLKIER